MSAPAEKVKPPGGSRDTWRPRRNLKPVSTGPLDGPSTAGLEQGPRTPAHSSAPPSPLLGRARPGTARGQRGRGVWGCPLCETQNFRGNRAVSPPRDPPSLRPS